MFDHALKPTGRRARIICRMLEAGPRAVGGRARKDLADPRFDRMIKASERSGSRPVSAIRRRISARVSGSVRSLA
jgi:hypothetical protein